MVILTAQMSDIDAVSKVWNHVQVAQSKSTILGGYQVGINEKNLSSYFYTTKQQYSVGILRTTACLLN